jgi:hypothetical protein
MATSETTEIFTYEVPEAGAMVGLSRNASYEAAKRGDIPTVRFGKRLKVLKAVWDRKLSPPEAVAPGDR